jgi:hypothetical protein
MKTWGAWKANFARRRMCRLENHPALFNDLSRHAAHHLELAEMNFVKRIYTASPAVQRRVSAGQIIG